MPNDPPRHVSTDQVNHHTYLCRAVHLLEAPCQDICHSFCRTLSMDDVPKYACSSSGHEFAVCCCRPQNQFFRLSQWARFTSVPCACRGESLVLLLLTDHIKQRAPPFTCSTSNGAFSFTSPNQGMPMFRSQLTHNTLMFSASLVPHSYRR